MVFLPCASTFCYRAFPFRVNVWLHNSHVSSLLLCTVMTFKQFITIVSRLLYFQIKNNMLCSFFFHHGHILSGWSTLLGKGSCF